MPLPVQTSSHVIQFDRPDCDARYEEGPIILMSTRVLVLTLWLVSTGPKSIGQFNHS